MGKLGKGLFKNTIYLYFLTFAKMFLPLLTLPYLTRVLSTDCYGMVTYVKAVMSYMQIFVDFGFVLSATRDIVNDITANNAKNVGRISGDVIASKCVLAAASAVVLLIMTIAIPILRGSVLFTWLYFLSIVLSVFVTDFLFRGLEKMELVTIPYVVTKAIATVLTLIFIQDDTQVLLIPVFEVAGTLAAIAVVGVITHRLGIRYSFSNIKVWWEYIRKSFVYFVSSFATTAFGVLNTLVVGIYLSPTDVAYWGLCMQLVGAVQNMYTPITNSLYPQMIQHRSRKLIIKIVCIFMPIVTLGCLFCLLCGDWVVCLVGGAQYLPAGKTFKCLIPVLFLSFPASLFGWPVLGAIGKAKETSLSSILAASVQILALIILGLMNNFSLINIAICRCVSELALFAVRFFYYWKNREVFG